MEDSLEEALRLKVKELRDTLTELRKKDFDVNVKKLQASLPAAKRCMICTLKIPCKHYKNLKEMPRRKTMLTSEFTKDFTEEAVDFTKFVPDFPPETKKIGFTVNYRGRERKYYIDPHVRTTSLPNEKRFNLLKTIEAYREEKLQEELKKLEIAKQEEEVKIQKKYAIEEMNKKYLVKQKEKLLKHKEEINSKREQLRLFIEKENDEKKKNEMKLQKYYEGQKKLLMDYHDQKRKESIMTEENVFFIDANQLSVTL